MKIKFYRWSNELKAMLSAEFFFEEDKKEEENEFLEIPQTISKRKVLSNKKIFVREENIQDIEELVKKSKAKLIFVSDYDFFAKILKHTGKEDVEWKIDINKRKKFIFNIFIKKEKILFIAVDEIGLNKKFPCPP